MLCPKPVSPKIMLFRSSHGYVPTETRETSRRGAPSARGFPRKSGRIPPVTRGFMPGILQISAYPQNVGAILKGLSLASPCQVPRVPREIPRAISCESPR